MPNTYYIGRFKNGKPRLLTFTPDEEETFKWDNASAVTHDSPRLAWDAFRADTLTKFYELSIAKEKLDRDFECAVDHL